MRKVLVFGVFDGLHKGHFYFLKQAKRLGDYLMVSVAQDSIIKKIKGRSPKFNLASRIGHLRSAKLADKIVPGDKKMSDYGVLIRHKPDVILLGYDQGNLKKDLMRLKNKFAWHPLIKTAKPYMPRRYHSGLLK